MYYLLTYKTIDDYVRRRAPFREAHLAYARTSQERGELFLAGALDDPPDTAILVFRASEKSVAENFARNDPYVKAGLITDWSVRPWTVVIGG
jgi:uncharacterized protein YciI